MCSSAGETRSRKVTAPSAPSNGSRRATPLISVTACFTRWTAGGDLQPKACRLKRALNSQRYGSGRLTCPTRRPCRWCTMTPRRSFRHSVSPSDARVHLSKADAWLEATAESLDACRCRQSRRRRLFAESGPPAHRSSQTWLPLGYLIGLRTGTPARPQRINVRIFTHVRVTDAELNSANTHVAPADLEQRLEAPGDHERRRSTTDQEASPCMISGSPVRRSAP